jgi:hypothetical protein
MPRRRLVSRFGIALVRILVSFVGHADDRRHLARPVA